ncbi:MAG TPA: hypothetical protein VLZ50_13555 [Terracidiphilus sp.]|nr:hypothetical protein [Terracidiphilus sp.]
MTPNIAIVHVGHTDSSRRGFRLWIPLFLFWIPAVLLSPFILLVLFGLCIAGRVDPFRAIRIFWDILCSLPGTNVHVRADRNTVLVRIL